MYIIMDEIGICPRQSICKERKDLMKQKLHKITSTMVFRMVAAVILQTLIFETAVCILGYRQFTASLTREYEDSARRTADTATAIVDGNKIREYLEEGGDTPDYKNRQTQLDMLCAKQNATLVYVIAVDTSDYGSFVSVFNSVGPDSGYDPWPLGYTRETTNEEYRDCYEDLYTGKRTFASILRTTNLRGNASHMTAMVPVKDSGGNVVAITCVQRPMSELTAGRSAYIRKILWAAVGMMLFAAGGMMLYLNREFVKPVHRIMKEADRFAKENTHLLNGTTGNISQVQEIQFLWDSLQRSEVETVRYIENLTRVTAENQRIGTELELARQIQANMLPNIFPPFPERKDMDIFATMTPAKEVGGDFYDFFLIDEDHLGVVMADVSGKGVPAALFMMMSKILIGNLAMLGGTPGEVLGRANNAICKHNDSDMFVTAWFGILTLSTGELAAANAGHEYPVIRRKDGSFRLYKDKHRPAIGVMEGMRYLDYTLELEKGDVLFLYTDGLPEATDRHGAMLGMDRMLEILNGAPEGDMRSLLTCTRAGVDEFVGDAPQFDDLTMLAVRRL